MLSLIAAHLALWLKARRDRAALRRLLDKGDHVLDDAGLTRGDVEAALGLSYRDDLIARARHMSELTLRLDQRV
ncbi:MAG: hypothetical protein AAF415_09280 [Pseudomonadota bacterium]